MHAAHLLTPIATRETVTVQHGRGSPEGVPYFPEGGVAAPPDMIVSPLTSQWLPNVAVGPPTVEFIQQRQSEEQGIGVPRFKAWPRQQHSEAYNFDTLAILPQQDQVGPINDILINRPEKAGWSAPYSQYQYEQPVSTYGLGSGVSQLRDPATLAYAVGWGYVGG